MKTKKTTKKTVTKKPLHVLVRSAEAGVHFGELVSRRGRDEVRLKNAIRIWYWDGAASLSELAVYGATNPATCRFGVPVLDHTVLGVCEIMACQPKAVAMIKGCPSWRA